MLCFLEILATSFITSYLPGVPKKKYWRLINNRTKDFLFDFHIFVSSFIFLFLFVLNKAYLNLDFETKIVEIC